LDASAPVVIEHLIREQVAIMLDSQAPSGVLKADRKARETGRVHENGKAVLAAPRVFRQL
ncbi:MAG TPA: hypothetical protein VFB75_21690, partial [Burkholderiales bacterium]|nr:hypothetical protein [Burkholderiales bacterium]